MERRPTRRWGATWLQEEKLYGADELKPLGCKDFAALFPATFFLVVFKMESEDSTVLLIKLSPVLQVETKSEHFEFG